MILLVEIVKNSLLSKIVVLDPHSTNVFLKNFEGN